MSIIKFDILEDHLKLVPFIKFNVDGHSLVAGSPITEDSIEEKSPFGGEDFYVDMGLMIYGKVEKEFDPHSEEGIQYTTDQKKYMDKLFTELPTVIEILLSTGTFKPGQYSRKAHGIDWKFRG